jgi:hypothetical protein
MQIYVQVVQEYERAVIFRLGRLRKVSSRHLFNPIMMGMKNKNRFAGRCQGAGHIFCDTLHRYLQESGPTDGLL